MFREPRGVLCPASSSALRLYDDDDEDESMSLS